MRVYALFFVSTAPSDYHGSNKKDVLLGEFGGARDDWLSTGDARVAHLNSLRGRVGSALVDGGSEFSYGNSVIMAIPFLMFVALGLFIYRLTRRKKAP
jgi:hypothetical protein